MIRGVHWAPKESIVRQARGSDNWPLTWGDDDPLYTAYGDGHGFEPPVPDKLSLGFAKVVGSARGLYRDQHPLGDRRTERGWGQGPESQRDAHGRRRPVHVGQERWQLPTGLVLRPCKDVDLERLAVRDELWLFDLPELRQGIRAEPGTVTFTSTPRMTTAPIRPPTAWFWRGCRSVGSPNGEPTSSSRFGRRWHPLWTSGHCRTLGVFTHPGGCYRSSVSYDAGLRRYLWCQTLPGGDARFRGGFGIYDAPEPWGPWTTAYFTDEWDVGPGETCSFPTKWMSTDGKTVHLVFSGDDSSPFAGRTLA